MEIYNITIFCILVVTVFEMSDFIYLMYLTILPDIYNVVVSFNNNAHNIRMSGSHPIAADIT